MPEVYGPEEHVEQPEWPLEEKVVKIYRCAKVIKGGRRFSFAAIVVVGDRHGRVGVGYGKANEVPSAVQKGIDDAKKNLIDVPMVGRTIPHKVWGKFSASKVVLLPASPGTGVIAGAAVRAVLELAGLQDVLSKAYGSTGAKNLIKATMKALGQLRDRNRLERLRGVELAK